MCVRARARERAMNSFARSELRSLETYELSMIELAAD